jgi:hypothetical protein
VCNAAKHRRVLRDHVVTSSQICRIASAVQLYEYFCDYRSSRLSVFPRPFYKDLVFPLFSDTDLRKSQYVTSYLSWQARRVHERLHCYAVSRVKYFQLRSVCDVITCMHRDAGVEFCKRLAQFRTDKLTTSDFIFLSGHTPSHTANKQRCTNSGYLKGLSCVAVISVTT